MAPAESRAPPLRACCGPISAVRPPLIHGRTLSAVSRAVDDVKVQEVSAEEGPALLDRAARHYLDMSGDEFAVAWEASPFDDDPGRPEVMAVAMLPPFGR